MKRAIVAAALCLMLATPAWAGFHEGIAAYNRGDYATALRVWRPLAEQGAASAQFNLGIMYDNGQGVPQDSAEAARWWRKAAAQGEAKAQHNLGFMYYNGQGVPQDYVRSHMWYNLAASRAAPGATRDRAVKTRDIVAARMTTVQIAEAQRLARAWRPKQQMATTSPKPVPATASANRQRITSIQRRLTSLGYDPGPADGILGPKSRAAIRAFQAREGLPVTGVISDGFEAALRSASRAVASTAPTAPRALKKTSTGSGFTVSGQGHILTNDHVVKGCREVRVAATAIDIIARDKITDLALLKKRHGKADDPARFRGGRGVRTGEDVLVVGYPLQGLLSTEMNVTKGTVSSLAGPGNDRNIMQITAPVQPGNSGGPVLDMAGNVVGVVVAKLNAIKIAKATGLLPENVNFAISEGAARAFLDAHDVPYETVRSEKMVPTADIAAKAKRYTVPVECWR